MIAPVRGARRSPATQDRQAIRLNARPLAGILLALGARMADPLVAARSSVPKCPSCDGVDVQLALQGPTYPIHWCGTCHTYFCCPPALATIARAMADISTPMLDPLEPAAPAAPAGASVPGRAVWRRMFGDTCAAVAAVGGAWEIAITDATSRCVIATEADGSLAEAQAKAERLVGYTPTGPWIAGEHAG